MAAGLPSLSLQADSRLEGPEEREEGEEEGTGSEGRNGAEGLVSRSRDGGGDERENERDDCGGCAQGGEGAVRPGGENAASVEREGGPRAGGSREAEDGDVRGEQRQAERDTKRGVRDEEGREASPSADVVRAPRPLGGPQGRHAPAPQGL